MRCLYCWTSLACYQTFSKIHKYIHEITLCKWQADN